MARTEFTKQVKRAALERAGMKCEGEGELYGLEPGKRCNANLSYGVIFDHVDPEANSHDASLENCKCICPRCNKHKTFKRDIPMIAKTVRQQDKNNSIRSASRKMPCGRNSAFKKRMDGTVVPR